MNRFPAFNGVFAVYFVVDVDNWRNVRTHYRNPSAAVGTDLSCPHICKHP
ncbi:MAG: hypothetical protein HXN92_02395 [Prevotella pallens]|nr:hypothetical protein [Prevotella pallens]MBF1525117.1 hypothetical protein [Prevotella pallens]